MKKNIILQLLCVLLIGATACSKKTDRPVAPPQPVPAERLSKLEFDESIIEVSYHADGSVQKMTNTWKATNEQSVTTFLYANGKLAEVNNLGRWKYYYTDNKLTKIETYNENGLLRYETTYSYTGNLMTERLQTRISSVGRHPEYRSFFTYHPDGNVLKQEVQQFVNGQWHYEEHILFPEYDNKPNYALPFEMHPYLPPSVFGGNNPLKEIYMTNNQITQVIEHSFTYDTQGRPATRKSVYKPVGYPEYSENLALFY